MSETNDGGPAFPIPLNKSNNQLACTVCGKRMLKVVSDDGLKRVFISDGELWEIDSTSGKVLCQEHASPPPKSKVTVGDLKKAFAGVPDNTPVGITDHFGYMVLLYGATYHAPDTDWKEPGGWFELEAPFITGYSDHDGDLFYVSPDGSARPVQAIAGAWRACLPMA